MKKIWLFVLAMVFAVTCLSFAVEQVNLVPPITIPSFRVVRLVIDIRGQFIEITLFNSDTGKDQVELYTGETALALVSQLNRANFTTNSLQKSILSRLITDGRLAGTVSGSPD
jgi:hypothetical protein